MPEPELNTIRAIESDPPKWLIFVNKDPDDVPWLRMMVLNPFNGAMCALINTPIEPETHLAP